MKNHLQFCTLLLSLLSTSLPAQNESLLIGPGDLLHLQVYDTPEMDQRARVTDAVDWWLRG
jgi:polysaccharide export outer membrane protein